MLSSDFEVTGFKPINDKVLVLPQEAPENKTKGGIILPTLPNSTDHLKEHVYAKVIAVAPKLESQIKVGDTVVYKKMYELTFDINNVRHVILKGEHIDLVMNAEEIQNSPDTV